MLFSRLRRVHMNKKDTVTQAIKLIAALYKEGLVNAATYRHIIDKYA